MSSHVNDTNGDYYRVRFQEGYVFRLQARDHEELRELAANHFWWGDQKPPVSEIKLSLKSRKNDPKVWYAVEAPQGYPKGQNDPKVWYAVEAPQGYPKGQVVDDSF
eukprot:g1560.t1